MTMRISLSFSALFLILLIIGSYTKLSMPNTYQDSAMIYVKILYVIATFSSFIFGIASSSLTLSLLSHFRKHEYKDIEYLKTNPIIWPLILREVKSEIDRS